MQIKGTVFDFSESQGDWFEFFESRIELSTGEVIYDNPKPGTGRACFRSTVPFIQERMATRTKRHEFVLNPKTRAMERVEFFESLPSAEAQQELDDMVDYAITGLERFFDAEGNAMECTRENKLKLSKVPVFDRYMARCLELQANAGVKQKEVAEKNSKKP